MKCASLWIVLTGVLMAPGVVKGQMGKIGKAEAGLEKAQDEFGLPAIQRLLKWEKDPQNRAPYFPIIKIVLIILVSAGCGAALAFHPHHRSSRVTSLVEMDNPKIIITYTVVGALVGLVVAPEPGLGLAIFGIGGLMRFRTELSAAKETGRVIIATIIGILCGLELWLVVVFGTGVAWGLIYILDRKVGYRIMVRGLDAAVVEESSNAYRGVLEDYGLAISNVKRNPSKGQSSIVFKGPHNLDRDALEAAFSEEVDEKLRGTIDWPEE